jgi:molybdopterin molybdotransferase
MADLLSMEAALALVLEHAQPLEAESVTLQHAAGRVLLAEARAAVDLPPFPSSAMDGFAVRSDETPGTLSVAEPIAAGRPASRALRPAEAMPIATGGVVPDGADAVVPIELVSETDNSVHVAAPVERGAHVRAIGGDVRAGETILPRGIQLGPPQLGAAAAAGVVALRCARRPRVAVLSTGTELRRPGEALAPGQIYESNATMLHAALAAAGVETEVLEPVADDMTAHREALQSCLERDVVITSGGVSVGPHDLVRSIERELGVEEVFWRVAVKPGKPLAFGVLGRTLVFGLPGNPVSALVGFELFVRPALRALQGAAEPGPHFAVGRLASALRRDGSRDALLRARTRADAGEVTVEPLQGQESHMIVRAAAANALVLVPRGSGELHAGERVRYLPI